jgi:hypothetical protein
VFGPFLTFAHDRITSVQSIPLRPRGSLIIKTLIYNKLLYTVQGWIIATPAFVGPQQSRRSASNNVKKNHNFSFYYTKELDAPKLYPRTNNEAQLNLPSLPLI